MVRCNPSRRPSKANSDQNPVVETEGRDASAFAKLRAKRTRFSRRGEAKPVRDAGEAKRAPVVSPNEANFRPIPHGTGT